MQHISNHFQITLYPLSFFPSQLNLHPNFSILYCNSASAEGTSVIFKALKKKIFSLKMSNLMRIDKYNGYQFYRGFKGKPKFK